MSITPVEFGNYFKKQSFVDKYDIISGFIIQILKSDSDKFNDSEKDCLVKIGNTGAAGGSRRRSRRYRKKMRKKSRKRR